MKLWRVSLVSVFFEPNFWRREYELGRSESSVAEGVARKRAAPERSLLRPLLTVGMASWPVGGLYSFGLSIVG